MSLTYTQDHNWWVQRVNKELMASSRFNMYNTRSTFYSGSKHSGFLKATGKQSNRPLTSKSVASLSVKSASRSAIRAADGLKTPENQGNALAGTNQGLASDGVLDKAKPSVGFVDNDSRPNSNQFSIRSGKSRPSTGVKGAQNTNFEKAQDDAGSAADNSFNFSTKSIQSGEDSETLKNYIKELEKLLRFEKIKRIQTEGSLKRLVSKSSSKSIQRFN